MRALWKNTVAGMSIQVARYPSLRPAAIFAASASSAPLLTWALGKIVFFESGWAVWWPMNAIALAVLLTTARRHWFWILAGLSTGLAAWECATGMYPLEAALDITGNLVEILIAAFALPAFHTLQDWLLQPRLQTRFCIFALGLGPAASALVVAPYYHQVHQGSFLWVSQLWGVADALGIAMLTPLVLVLFSRDTYRLFHWRRLAHTLGLLLLVIATTWSIFHQQALPILFVIFPVMLVVALRLEFSGSVIAVNLVAVIATSATIGGTGPMQLVHGAAGPYRILLLQIFLGLTMLMGFPIAVMLIERARFESRLQVAYAQMEKIAAVDGLTGVANRRTFQAALDTEWRRAQREQLPVALLMLDADNFKGFNDLYGHLAGDECLCAVAQAVAQVPQRPKDLLARFGGEEFVVLLPGTDAPGMIGVAEAIRARVEQMGLEHIGNISRVVTVSVGCAAILPREGLDACRLIEAADRALYAAKQNGRNRIEIGLVDDTRFEDDGIEEEDHPGSGKRPLVLPASASMDHSPRLPVNASRR